MELERLGVPTALFLTGPFTDLAALLVKGKGLARFPLVVVPHPFGTLPDGQIEQIADSVLDRVVQVLTSPDPDASGGGAKP